MVQKGYAFFFFPLPNFHNFRDYLVKERYYRRYFARQGSRLLGESARRVAVVERFLKNLLENYLPKEGEKGVSRLDWLKAATLVSQILARREEALAQEELTDRALRDYCRIGEDQSIADRLSPILLPPPEEALEKVRSGPGRELAQKEVEIARSEIRFAKGSLYPEVGLFGFFSYTRQNFPSEPTIGGGGVMVKFPLFDGGERGAEKEIQEARTRRASLEVERQEEEMTLTVGSLYRSAEELKRRIAHLKEAVRRAGERRGLASESYLMNFGDYKDYLDALKEEIEGQGLLLATQLQYWMTETELEGLTGS